MMTTFLDAAYHVLAEYDRPMSYEEITQGALDRGLITTHGATPVRTMAAKLYMDIKTYGTDSRFIQIGPNRFALNDHRTSQLLSTSKTTAKKQRPQSRKPNTKVMVGEVSSAHKLLDQEMSQIQAFLSGKSEQPPTSEKICDWVALCYCLGLYTEGAGLFGYVDATEVNEWYYERTKKLPGFVR